MGRKKKQQKNLFCLRQQQNNPLLRGVVGSKVDQKQREEKKIGLLTHPVHHCILTLMMYPLSGFCNFQIRPAFQQVCVAVNPLQSMELLIVVETLTF